MQTCETCRYVDATKRGNLDWAECRRHPPDVIKEGQHLGYGLWPKVEPTDWCGDYETQDTLVEGVDRG